MNWKEMEIFKGIDLNDSFVLSWTQTNNELTFDIEASIWPESPYYEKPAVDDYTCYKNAYISFKGINTVSGLRDIEQITPSSDASGEKDYGNIDSLQENEKGFQVEGDFGVVTIIGGAIEFGIK